MDPFGLKACTKAGTRQVEKAQHIYLRIHGEGST